MATQLREDEQFDASRADPRELYEKTGFFGGPKKKFRLALICLCVGVALAKASGRSDLSNWLRDALLTVCALSWLSFLFLARWCWFEYRALNRPVAKDRPKLWRWRG